MGRLVTATSKNPPKAPPPTLPAAMRPSEHFDALEMRGMRIRRGRLTGVVRHSYEDSKLGPRAFVKFDDGCSGWIDVFALEPE